MATVRKTITLTQQQNVWIAAQIDAGRYTNDSEAIRDLIRREQERGIRQALIEGEQSGEPEAFDFAAFKQSKAKPSSTADSRCSSIHQRVEPIMAGIHP